MIACMMCSIMITVTPRSFKCEKRREHLVDLRLGKTGHDLVGDQQSRIAGKGAREFELAQLEVGQRFGRMIGAGGKPDQSQKFARAGGPLFARPDIVERDLNVLEHGNADKGARDLEAARNAAPRPSIGGHLGNVDFVENHRAAFWTQNACDAIDQCRLARAVGPDDSELFAARDIEIDARQRRQARRNASKHL